MKAAHRQKRKEERALELETILRDAEDDGFQLVSTNGPSEKIEGIFRLGGYGVYSENCISLFQPMPLNMKQTNKQRGGTDGRAVRPPAAPTGQGGNML